LGHVNAHHAALDMAHHERQEVQRIDNRDEVQKMLADLPDMEAKIVRQYHIEGRTYREISDGLGVPENSIGPALSRARAKLRGREVKL
jgi:RNA polymerase sigma-70 factor (ECF subfamily)